MRWLKHKEKWSACDLCEELCRNRNRVVLARGKIPAPILIVGEAPGNSEDVIGKPFIGPAGHLLDYIIEQSIDGQYDYAITNLVCCVPKRDDGSIGEPSKEEIENCRDRLVEFIGMVKPKLVICVGALASKNALPAIYSYSPRPIVVSITHPAGILRMNPVARPLELKRCVATICEGLDGLE